MSYARQLSGLELIKDDKYIEAIRRDIDDMAAKMEHFGYAPADIRRFFRELLARCAGPRCGDYMFDLVVAGWLSDLADTAQEQFDRSRFPTSLGLLWTMVFGEDGAVENCRWKVDNVWVPNITEAERRAAAERDWKKCQRRFPNKDIPLSWFLP